MKKGIKLLLLIAIILLPVSANAIVKKSQDIYITDEAGILKKEVKDYIVRYSEFLYRTEGINYYVVIVKNLDGEKIENYTEEVYEQYGIGEKGLLILLSKEDRKIRIQAGNGLLDFINGPIIDDYIDTYFIPYMEQEKWNEGVVNGYNAFYKKICEEYEIDASEMEVIDKLDFLTKYKTPIIFVIVWISIASANVYANYYKKLKKNISYNEQVKETIKFGIVLVINIALLSLSYLLEPIYLAFVLAFEGVSMYSSLNASNNKKGNEYPPKRETNKDIRKKQRGKRRIRKTKNH